MPIGILYNISSDDSSIIYMTLDIDLINQRYSMIIGENQHEVVSFILKAKYK